jgi:hypothetical protein
MGPLDIANHLLNFVAPAAALAVLMVLAGWIFKPKSAPALAWYAQVAILFVVCVATLAAGLWWWGRDGRMATYAALVVVAGTCQWLLIRGWRR